MGDKPTGLGIYAANCCANLPEKFDAKLIANKSTFPSLKIAYESPDDLTIGSGKLSALKRNIWLRRLKLRKNHLVYTPTHHGLSSHDDQIITIHDLICLRHPTQHIPQFLYFRFVLPQLLKKCRAVFTVSETSKIDINNQYNYPLKDIYVIPNGVDTKRFTASSAPQREDFLLVVGARYPHKNLIEVLEQSSLWKDKYKLLVTSCSGKYRKAINAKINHLGLADNVIFYDYVSNEQLVELYQNCKALIYVSKWEGFGIPPLEALSCGARVIASDIPVLRETLDGAVEFITLGDKASWEAAFANINTALCPEQKKMIDNLLVKYTWQNAEKKLYDALLNVEPSLKSARPHKTAELQKP